jgi:hypothetical protein
MSGAQLHLLHPARQLSRRRAALAGAVLLGGCYTYRPLPDPDPVPGSRVQLVLTTAGSDTLATRIGPGIDLVEGEVVRAGREGITLAVREVENLRGERSDWLGERVSVPRRFIEQMQQRRVSLGGTGLLGGAIAAGLVAATAAIGGRGEVQGGNGGGGAAGN